MMKDLYTLLALVIVATCVDLILCAEQCNLKPEPGPCLAYFPRYYYDPAKSACAKFVYGGCQGNTNNFETLADCEIACDPCQQQPEVGFCKAMLLRYFYNSATNACDSFFYGGCQGNANNFETIDACKAACGSTTKTQ